MIHKLLPTLLLICLSVFVHADTAVDEIMLKAKAGDRIAQTTLALIYANGERGIEKNKKLAWMWFNKAAEQGDARAQFCLGLRYYQGLEVTKDYQQAISWYTKAADQGYIGAQINLGQMYGKGEGTEQDDKRAAMWITKAAEQGSMPGQLILGRLYEIGKGVTQDYQQAIYWYTKSAEQGDIHAQFNLGLLYGKGQGSAHLGQDYIQSVKWFTKSAEQGDPTAQYCLGLMYEGGHGVAQDNLKAYVWFLISAANGNANAAIHGENVSRNLDKKALAKVQQDKEELIKLIEHNQSIKKSDDYHA